MSSKKITIAIDGFSACGKSTLARELAKKLDYTFIDSGAMYRGVTLYAIQHDYVTTHEILQSKLIDSLPDIKLKFKRNDDGTRHLFLNGKDVESEIRNKPVSDLVSPISAIKEIRTFLVAQQQEMGKNGGIVMDGRDIGTVVFPNAEIKLFITASIEIRVQRRLKELLERGIQADAQEVRDNLTQRDYIDSTRAESPLKKASDAIEIDNSTLTKEQQLDLALSLVNQQISNLLETN